MHRALGRHDFPPTTCIRIHEYVAKPPTNTVFVLGQLILRERFWVRMIRDADLSLMQSDIKMMTFSRSVSHLFLASFDGFARK